MNWKLFNQPLGTIDMSGGYAPRKKAIPLAVPLVMAAGSALSSWLGGNASKKANEEAQRKLEAEKAELNAERMRAKYQSWLDTASGQNTLRMLRDEADRSYLREKGAAAVGGATEAAGAAEKERQMQKQAEVIAQAEAAHEDKKDQVDASYRQQISGLNQQQINLDREKGQNIAGAAAGMSNALAQGAISTFGGTKLGQQWMGNGSPAGGGVTPQNQPSQLQQMAKAPTPDMQRQIGMQHYLNYGKNYDILKDLPDFQRIKAMQQFS